MDSWIISEYLAQAESAHVTLANESPKARMRREWEALRKLGTVADLKRVGRALWPEAVVARRGNPNSASACPHPAG
jgi:hypothetical protein